MFSIRTRYIQDTSGAKIVARGGGVQRTVAVDGARSLEANHGLAAGTVARVHFGQVGHPAITHLMQCLTHDKNRTGTEHVFGPFGF